MDFNTFLLQVKKMASHPAIRLCLLPFFYALYGFVFGARLGRVNFLGDFIFVLFLLVLQFLEQYFFVSQSKKGYINWSNASPLLGLAVLFLLVMFPLTNLVFMLLGAAYLVSLLLIYGFFRLKGSIYYLILQVFLKGVVVSVLATFMQVNFISLRLLVEILPLVFALLFYFSELEILDSIKYGQFHSRTLWNGLALLGLVGTFVAPIALGKLGLAKLPMLMIWVLLFAFVGQYLLRKSRFASVEKSKNFTATLLILMILIYSLV